MKKIIFVMYGLGIGGVEKCLINLVNNLDSNSYDITIAVMNPEYELLNTLRKNITLIKFEDYFINTTDSWNLIKKEPCSLGKWRKVLRYCVYRIAVKLHLKSWRIQKKICGNYDFAVAYTHVGNVPEYVLDQVQARQKILWYHTTWTDIKCFETYSRFNRIVAVSESCRSAFVGTFPSLSSKLYKLNNFYDISDIILKSKQMNYVFDKDKSYIVTVGRVSTEKGVELAIRACSALKGKINTQFRWIWIGDGPIMSEMALLVKKLGLQDIFIFVGANTNPYQFMAQCDIYVQTSEREAFCTTIMEAKFLGKPIVSTNFKSAYEQIDNGINGLIAEPKPECLAECILKLLKDDNLRNELGINASRIERKNDSLIKDYALFWGN